MARTLATLAVIIGFFIYIMAANIYVSETYFRGRSAGPAVPFTKDDNPVLATCFYKLKHLLFLRRYP
jgi:hypothetical protein